MGPDLYLIFDIHHPLMGPNGALPQSPRLPRSGYLGFEIERRWRSHPATGSVVFAWTKQQVSQEVTQLFLKARTVDSALVSCT